MIFDAFCFSLALYMTIQLVGRFNEHKSATSIDYKKYTDTSEDKYPAFSMCLKGDNLYRYNESAIFEAYQINPAEYQMLLKGKPAYRFDYDATRGLYYNKSLPLRYETNFTFKEMVKSFFELSDIIKEAELVTEEPGRSIIYGKKTRLAEGKTVDDPPFYVSYQTSKILCFTRESILGKWYSSNSIRRKDVLYLGFSFLDSTTEVDIIIHYPDQLIRNLNRPRLGFKALDMDGKKYQIKISQSTVLKKKVHQT